MLKLSLTLLFFACNQQHARSTVFTRRQQMFQV